MYIKVGEAWIEKVFLSSVMLTLKEEKAEPVDNVDIEFLRDMFGSSLEFYEKEITMKKVKTNE